MSENLVKEYIARLNKLKEMTNIDEGDLNIFLELHPKIEKQVWEMAILLDLITSNKEEEFVEGSPQKTYPKTSKMFERIKNKVLSKGGELDEKT